jgi:hypothetical protein
MKTKLVLSFNPATMVPIEIPELIYTIFFTGFMSTTAEIAEIINGHF